MGYPSLKLEVRSDEFILDTAHYNSSLLTSNSKLKITPN